VKRAFAVAALVVLMSTRVEAAPEKTFVYHLNAAPDGLDPAKCNNVRCQRVMWPIYEPLINLSKDLRVIEPGLAESWEVAPDRLRYTFRLRKGVTFHDGTPFTAASVKINLERNFLPGSRFYTATPPNVREKMLAGIISGITVEDDHTLTVVLKARRPHLLFFAPIVSPEALARYGAKVGEHPTGTGPFKLTRWTGEEIRLTPNPGYWGGRPKIDQLSFRIIPQSERTTQEFLSGRVDFLPEVEPVYIERIVANPTTKLMRVPTLSLFYLGFRMDRKPLSNLHVRQALTRAIDVDRAVLFTSRGAGAPAHGPLPEGIEGYDPGLKRPSFQPEAARRLLAEAGYPQGIRVSLAFNAGWGFFAELAHAIKADLAKAGIVVDLMPLPGYRELVADIREGKADLFIYNWFIPSTDAEAWLVPLFQTHSVDNLTRYGNPAVDRMLEQAKTMVDDRARLDLYRKAQRVIVDDAPMVFLFHEIRVSAYNTRVVGLQLNAQSYPLDRFARIDLRAD
jgi:peptide/nickel transport system substrate-binding protein